MVEQNLSSIKENKDLLSGCMILFQFLVIGLSILMEVN
jgi:hypothetical protein